MEMEVHPDEVLVDRNEYERLKERDEWLSDLEYAGVDNWQGMEEAIRIHNERLGEDV